ncbi:MAG: A/G-specific adenine glycosylase [Halobacteria archaeon]
MAPALSKKLLPWFRTNKRDLPWRRTYTAGTRPKGAAPFLEGGVDRNGGGRSPPRGVHRRRSKVNHPDPYAIWVSEAMLQQTRVEAAVDYYRRFLRRFPTVEALARAPESEVLKAWEGLGYYSRARHLRRAAEIVVREHGGRVPRDPEAFGALPGVGPYIRGAVMSIAYDLPEPILDGNVKRVLARYFAVTEPLPKSEPRLRGLAADVLDRRHPGEFNEALMELGATVCTPREPKCDGCPIRRGCRARARGLQDSLPRRAPRGKVPRHEAAVGVVRRGERILIALRPSAGLLGGLWELPGGKRKPGESLAGCAAREIAEETGLRVRAGRRLATVEHAYTHFKVTLHAYECAVAGGRARPIGCAEVRWVRPRELENYAFPRANRKLFEQIGEVLGW